ncbi:MAG: hypothetical protein HC881_15975 [Leptolyngbyaceae cyanobacterium SL_7_1]|nr:hypothetical protein [Leptolyngbyaceae cyanobacterium SL_7_1]
MYRRDPVSSFILTVGAVDAVMGGVGDRGSLLVVGLVLVGVGLLWRWSKPRLREPTIERPPLRALPSQASRPPLPILHSSQHDGSR